MTKTSTKWASATLASFLVVGCAPSESTVEVHSTLVVNDEILELSRWVTIVYRKNAMNTARKRDRIMTQLQAVGADQARLLPQISVAFARFENIEDAQNVKDGVVVLSNAEDVGGINTYSVPGLPNVKDVMERGREALEEFEPRTAERIQPQGVIPEGHFGALQPEDVLYLQDWGLRRIRADHAWELATGSHDTVVAVVDTGIASNHPDLADNLVHRACFTFSSVSKATGNGQCSLYPTTSWHGTHVAGTIAAKFGGGAAVGVGPGLGLASYNVFENILLQIDTDEDGEADLDLALPLATDIPIFLAVLDAADRGFQVQNLSLGLTAFVNDDTRRQVNALKKAWARVIEYADRRQSTIVVAAGNEGDIDFDEAFPELGLGVVGDLDNPNFMSLPAEIRRAITVGATGIRPHPFRVDPSTPQSDVRAFYSNFGRAVDIAAPGGDFGPDFPNNFDADYQIMSTWADIDPFFKTFFLGESFDITCALEENCEIGYAGAMGTSMAAPHVAGTVGLLYDVLGSEPADINPRRAHHLVRSSGSRELRGERLGRGVLNAQKALRIGLREAIGPRRARNPDF